VKLCVSIEIQEGVSYREALALALTAEEAGFDAALLAEHYCASSGSADSPAPEAWVYLGALARETERIRLGTLVSPVTFRHPSVLAKLAATLDHVSGGRAELGLGAGWLEAEHAAYGFEFPTPAQRVDLLEEQLQVLTGLWSRAPFTHDGRYYHLRNCSFTPTPVQKPHPPLIVGGRPTSRRLPRLAARYAQEYCVAVPTPSECEQVATLLGGSCGLSVFTYVCVAESDEEVRLKLQTLTGGLRPDMRRVDRWIVGTPEAAARQLDDFARAGVDRIFVAVWEESQLPMVRLLGRVGASTSNG
jgi:alkanesulfonate monooxygenase SsuD/methylene tetrahydromethanopterin reductase-like flavin-dependent oxidoreductase (luciferase family)